MFKKEKIYDDSFKEELNSAIAVTLKATLESILKTDCKKANSVNGREETDFELTARTMKSQARVALDLISNLQGKEER